MIHVAVLIPTVGRAAQMEERVGQLARQIPPAGVTLLIMLVIPHNDADTRHAAARLLAAYDCVQVSFCQPGTNAVDGWNQAYKASLVYHPNWFVLGADDCIWHNGWLDAAVSAIEEDTQVVGLHDTKTDLNFYATHYMASAQFCRETLGGHIAPPEYQSWWFDREVCDIARKKGVYTPAWQAVVEHRHPDWGTAEQDSTYEIAMPRREADYALYMQRRCATA